MNAVNKTLFIPLYGKAYVSRRGLFLEDKKAEEIWNKEGFPLKGKSRSKWLAFYMGIRAAVFDEWLRSQMTLHPDAVILHIGCGLDSRILRVGSEHRKWYDIDFPEVIAERKRFFPPLPGYEMVAGDARDPVFLNAIPKGVPAIVVMEGICMYLTSEELKSITTAISTHFSHVSLLMDCYTALAAKISKIKNPVKDVGVTQVYGMDDTRILDREAFVFLQEHPMTPQTYIDELEGTERAIFQRLYAGSMSKKLYRLFEYTSNQSPLHSKKNLL